VTGRVLVLAMLEDGQGEFFDEGEDGKKV